VVSDQLPASAAGSSDEEKMKKSRAKIIVSVLVIAGLAEALRYRIYAENWYWHFRHGEVLVVGEYRVPVPRNWFVEDTGVKGGLLLRLDTQDRTGNSVPDAKLSFRALVGVSLDNVVLGSEKMEKMRDFHASMVRRAGSEPVFRSFDLGGETLSCVGGQTFNEMLRSGLGPSVQPLPQFFKRDPNVWFCQSSGRLMLNLSGTEADMPQIWGIVSHIRKAS
jgi:hypothetical protein